MTTTIALAGKGGTGKTTVSAMIVKYLINKGQQPILAIDADPSANLNMVLGVDLDCHCWRYPRGHVKTGTGCPECYWRSPRQYRRGNVQTRISGLRDPQLLDRKQ